MRSGILILVLGQALAIFGAHHIRTGTASVEDFQSFFSSGVEPKGQKQASRPTAPTQDTSSGSNPTLVGDQTNRNTKSNSFEFQSNRNDNSFRSQDDSFGSQGNRNEDTGFGRTDDDFYWQQLGGLEEFDSNVFYNWDSFEPGSSSGKVGNNPGPSSSDEFDDDDEEIDDEDEDEDHAHGNVEERSGSSGTSSSSGSSGSSKPKCQKLSRNSLVPGPNNKDYYFSWSKEQYPSKGKSWKKARDFCLDHCMDLVAVESPKENDFIASHLERAKYVEGAWIGARLCFAEPDCPKNSHWYWVSSKKKLPKTGAWSRTGGLGDPQPDNLCQYYGGPKEECGAMLDNWFRDGVQWHDLACAQRLGFVCEVQVTPASKSSRRKRSAMNEERSHGRGNRRTRQEVRNRRHNRNQNGNRRSKTGGRANASTRNRHNSSKR